MNDDYDRYVIRRGDRMYLVRRRREPTTRNFDDDGDGYYRRHQAPHLPGTNVPVILDHDPRDLSAAPDDRVNKRARVAAATETAIQGLPELTPNPKLPPAECAVCLKELDDLDKLRAMPCAHAFHEQCIFQWLRRNAVCPLCRNPLPPAQHEEDEEASCNQLNTPAPEDP